MEDVNTLILKIIDTPTKNPCYQRESIMAKYIADERTRLKYELVGDHYFIAGDGESENYHIGIWGQRQAE